MSDRSLATRDTDAVTEAVDALEEAGFDVQNVDSVSTAGQGVEFGLEVRKITAQHTLGGSA